LATTVADQRRAEVDHGVEQFYAYCGAGPSSNASLLIFGGADVGKAAAMLDQTAAVAAGNQALLKAASPAGRPCAGQTSEVRAGI